MNITREWIIASKCPDCDTLMEALTYVQERAWKEAPNMPEMWTMSSGFTQGAAPFTCKGCGKTHETKDVTPQMYAVEPGTRVLLSERGRGPRPLMHQASVGEWIRAANALQMKTQAPLIAKITDAIASYADDEMVVKIHLTLDEQIAVSRALEDDPAATGLT